MKTLLELISEHDLTGLTDIEIFTAFESVNKLELIVDRMLAKIILFC